MSAPLHAVHVFSTFDPGGPQVRAASLISGLGDEFEHSILAMDSRYGCRERVEDARVRAWLDLEAVRPGLRKLKSLRQYLLAQEPDLVLTYNWGAIETVLALRRSKLGLVHHEDGFGPDEQARQKLRRVLTRRFALRRAQAVIVPSQNLFRLARDRWRLPESLIRYVPNGIDLEYFEAIDRNVARQELELPRDAFIVASVGHLRPEKNYVRLVESFAKLTRVDSDRKSLLVLVGDGPERAKIEASARAMGIEDRLVLTGPLQDPRPAYAACDVFALSSDTEQMPVALLEAMAMRRPVVSTAVGDVRDMLAIENRGFVVEAAQHADALIALAQDAAKREDLGRLNRERCEASFTRAGMVDAYRNLYRAAWRSSSCPQNPPS